MIEKFSKDLLNPYIINFKTLCRIWDVRKEYNSFYQTVSILGEENEAKKIFRVQLSHKVAETIKLAFQLLGIEVPERM